MPQIIVGRIPHPVSTVNLTPLDMGAGGSGALIRVDGVRLFRPVESGRVTPASVGAVITAKVSLLFGSVRTGRSQQ